MGRNRRRSQTVARRVLDLAALERIVGRARAVLSAEEHAQLTQALETLAWLTRELETTGVSIARLRAWLFGTTGGERGRPDASTAMATTSAAHAVNSTPVDATPARAAADDAGAAEGTRKGHGRNGAEAYPGAALVTVAHRALGHADRCPRCERGKVYRQAQPQVLVRIVGMAPLHATRYECERLRCNLCGEVFTAPAPAGVGEHKYDETATAMVALLHYGCGLPFHRLERLQERLGIPLPATTQWELVSAAAPTVMPVYEEMVRQAARGEVVYHDDTAMKILALHGQTWEGPDGRQRSGVFTSGIVATRDGREIALFFTGRKHAGENLTALLAERAAELAPPIQMCDASSRNTPAELQTILAHCAAHARRRFADVAPNFPEQCQHVLAVLGDVYRIDARARQEHLSPDARLRMHQAESGPVMQELKQWLEAEINERRVEPNSGLGEAIGYLLKYWEPLTLFLREPGAPLDNNVAERALKKAIIHRKNSLFYKTENGAHVGDLFMTAIYTTERARGDPFDYLVALQRHHEEVAKAPAHWMPWSYRDTLAARASAPAARG
jgi:hypothetical protein